MQITKSFCCDEIGIFAVMRLRESGNLIIFADDAMTMSKGDATVAGCEVHELRFVKILLIIYADQLQNWRLDPEGARTAPGAVATEMKTN